MAHTKSMIRYGLAFVAAAVLSGGLAMAQDDTDARLTDSQLADHAAMNALGAKYKTAWDLFQALKKAARGGQPITVADEPDWSGIYTRTKGGLRFDPDGPAFGSPSAKFTPKYAEELRQTVANLKKGIEYDPLSQCNPPTYPRWLDLPFMREFMVTPNETWMISEAFNSIRRIYTDGRGHLPVDDRFPTETGDSIGFWDGDRLIVHTTSSIAHMYERAQGYYSDQVEGVEIWHKIDDKTLVANVWIYDPPALLQAWYTRQSYTKIDDRGGTIRINNWYCTGSANNDVRETANGGSQFTPFTWEKGQNSGKASGSNAGQEKPQ